MNRYKIERDKEKTREMECVCAGVCEGERVYEREKERKINKERE